MKASEMTNEELAGSLESIVARRYFAIYEESCLLEAAARLRKIELLEMALKISNGMNDAAAKMAVAKNAEIAELREYLKDAASLRCGECWFTAHEGKCPHSLDKDCVAITWRKASEGVNNEQH